MVVYVVEDTAGQVWPQPDAVFAVRLRTTTLCCLQGRALRAVGCRSCCENIGMKRLVAVHVVQPAKMKI
jgi:hypothetical protein